MRDAVIIGKGPAALSAAIYLKRANLDVLVIGKDAGALEKAGAIENYFGVPGGLTGPELLEKGYQQARELSIDIRTAEVTGLRQEEYFIVQTTEGETEARAVLLATGKSRAGLQVPGFEEFRGKGISFCAVCDGFFYRDRALAVIGSGDYAAAEIADLNHFTQDITLFTDGTPLTTGRLHPDQRICTEKILEILGEEQVKAVRTEGGEYPVDGVFVAVGTASAADFAAKLGAHTSGGSIVVDPSFMTTVEGVFAAGDCIGGFLQVAKAVSDGAVASKSMITYIKRQKERSAG